MSLLIFYSHDYFSDLGKIANVRSVNSLLLLFCVGILIFPLYAGMLAILIILTRQWSCDPLASVFYTQRGMSKSNHFCRSASISLLKCRLAAGTGAHINSEIRIEMMGFILVSP